jgi:hypothetical protein
MAQQTKRTNSATKQRSSSATRPRSNGRSAKSASSNGKPSQTKAPSRASTTRSRSSTTRGRSNSSNRSSNKRSAATKAKEAKTKGARSAGDAISATAKRLKTPAIAAGTGLAGLAGGIALTRSRLKKTHTFTGAAKNLGALAERTGHVAEQVRVVSEALGSTDSQQRRSPVEVVLEGLTRRSQAPRPR